MSVAVSINNISKLYRLGETGTGSLAHDVNRWWHKLRGNEDPYLKVGQSNDRETTGGSEYVYAVKDVSFEIEQGEVLGIIGRNGAGKSTLLKILSRVTTPTTGQIKVKGRIASLLEVGTGFHPELTGRENIFLNGAILGMRRSEITSKFDEIVEFSGCERYIDTPVKRYSSGMYVRLAFAVAAHLEPEVLIVDEVLAVGDAEFQKKCMGKMKDVAGHGRTVLFVSHNIGAVSSLCSSVVSLANGQLVAKGPTEEVINSYLNRLNFSEKTGLKTFKQDDSKEAQILGVRILDNSGGTVASVGDDEEWAVEVEYLIKKMIPDMTLGVRITDQRETRIGAVQYVLGKSWSESPGCPSKILIKFERKQISPRHLTLSVGLHIPNVALFDEVEAANILEIVDMGGEFSKYGSEEAGVVFLRSEVMSQKVI